MPVLFGATILFTCGLVIQCLVWRARVPQNQMAALERIFLYLLAGWGGLAMLSLGTRLSGVLFPGGLFSWLRFFLLYLSATAAYLVTYSAVEADSPSLSIVLKVEKAGPAGLDKGALSGALGNETLILPRLRDLVRDQLVVVKDGRYRITRPGALFVSLFLAYRRILNVPQGG